MRAHNRKLNDDMTVLRNELSECRGQLERSTEVNTSLTAKISELEQANERLENDLMEMNDHTEARSVAPSRFTRAPSTAWGRISPTTSIIGTRAGADAAAENEVNASILPIITQQRDRFKARNTELEGDLKALQAKVQQLQSETQTLQKDNVALYERNRYLASYRTEGQTTGRDTVINMSGSSGGTKQSGLMDRYASKYEESVSPFESFRQRVTYTMATWLSQGANTVFNRSLREPYSRSTRLRKSYTKLPGLYWLQNYAEFSSRST